jgi:esterase
MARLRRDMRVPTDKTLAADDGLLLNLVDFGGSEGPPILFLHGSFGHARVWDFVVDALKPGRKAFALDMAGHGRSEHAAEPGRYALHRMVADVRRAVAELPAVPVLVGHSFGSALAMAYASRYPATLAGAVFIDIDPHVPEYQVDHLHEAGAPLPKRYDEFARAVARESRVAPGASPEVHLHLATHGFRQDGGEWVQRFDQQFLRTIERWDVREGLADITVPALVLRGSESTVMSPVSVDFMLEELPRAHAIEISGAGHQLHLERPADLAAAIEAFVAEVQYARLD